MACVCGHTLGFVRARDAIVRLAVLRRVGGVPRLNVHEHATERVLAASHGIYVVLHEVDRDLDDPVDRLERRLDGPAADRGLDVLRPLRVDERDGRCRAYAILAVRAGGELERLEGPGVGFGRVGDAVGEDGFNVRVSHVLLLVCDCLELTDELLELSLVLGDLGVAEGDKALLEGGLARVLAQDERGVGADALGRHDLVGGRVLEHAVLVDARLVRKGVRADDRLVGLHGDARVERDHL
mmetsp:Transcript_6382/g.20062  ORF Transcript_6382/g.20062 Transcript_6382/m.20062 type:complete len:240 (-) Transcript_6382:911-1630(-)